MKPVAHRDDHQAALLRAEALEGELAETKEALAAKERTLKAREAKLAEREADAAEREKQHTEDSASKKNVREDAEATLETLRRRGAKAAAKSKDEEERRRAEAIQSKDRDEQQETKLRVIRSSSFSGGLFASDTLMCAIPLFALSAGVFSWLPMEWAFGCAGGVVATLFFFAYIYPPIRAKQLPSEIGSLPYATPGFLTLLAMEAPKKDECILVVTLEFADAPPADLGALMKAADVNLEPMGGSRFRRAFPISVHRSKHGTRWSNHDTNRPLNTWFWKLERKVLRPVHALHPISAVTLSRKTSTERFP